MARAAAAGFLHCARTLLWVLWIFTWTASPTGAPSLCYNFTSCKSESGSWFNGVQGLLNKKIFLDYNSNSNKYQYFGLLENRLKGTQVSTEQLEWLKDTIDLLKQQLLDIKTTNIHREPLSLQATMCCQVKGDGNIHGHWNFSLGEQNMIHRYSANGKWTVDHPGFSWLKEKDVTDFLHRSLEGDCRKLLLEFLLHGKEELDPTAPITTVPDTALGASAAVTIRPCVLLVTLTCSLMLLILENPPQ